MRARCERGAQIARLLGLSEGTADAIRTLDEHWDGHGQPEGLRGDEIPLAGRILCLAQTVEIFHAQRGLDAALQVAQRRSGGWFDPQLVAALRRTSADAAFWRSLPAGELAPWEPQERRLTADDAYLDDLARAVAGDLGGRVGVAPRLFLRKLVGDVLDRIDQHPDFDPRRHYELTIADGELTRVERAARGAGSADDVELDL